MFKRGFPFLLLSCVVAGLLGAATDPFIGTWTLNASKSKAIDSMQVKPVGANRYAITFAPGATDTITADGSDQPGLRGTTLSVSVEGPAMSPRVLLERRLGQSL